MPDPAPRKDRVLLAVALCLHTALWALGIDQLLLDVDVANLTYGMVEYNLAHFNPHPPGYLLYVLALRGLHVLRWAGSEPLDRLYTAQLLSAAFGLGTVAMTYAAARRLFTLPGAAGWSALFVALHPLLVYHSIDAQTHTSEAFAAAWLLKAAVDYEARPGVRQAVVAGLVLALGSAFRPSFVLFGVPLVTWIIGFARFRDLLVAGAVSIVGALAWFVPTIIVSGGYALWSSATHALVHDAFVRTSSPLASGSYSELTQANLRALGVAIAQISVPALVGWGLLRSGGGTFAPVRVPARRLFGAAAVGCLVPSVYYALTFFSEPGYLLTAVPPVGLFVGALAHGRRGALAVLCAVLLALGGGLLPPVPLAIKVASVDTWQSRTQLVRAVQYVLDERLPPGQRVLMISDFPDLTVSRQLSMLRPDLDVLMIHDGRLPWHSTTSLTYVTRADVVPIPTSHVLSAEGATRLAAEGAYDFVYVDEMVSAHMQAAIAQQSRCPFRPALAPGEYRLLPVTCLRAGELSFDGITLTIQAR